MKKGKGVKGADGDLSGGSDATYSVDFHYSPKRVLRHARDWGQEVASST